MKRIKKVNSAWRPYTRRAYCLKTDNGKVGDAADQEKWGMPCRIISEADYQQLLKLAGLKGRRKDDQD